MRETGEWMALLGIILIRRRTEFNLNIGSERETSQLTLLTVAIVVLNLKINSHLNR